MVQVLLLSRSATGVLSQCEWCREELSLAPAGDSW